MIKKYPNLLSPIRLGNLTLNNRMFAAPMSHPGLDLHGHYTPDAIAYYEMRAKGGVASVCCSEAVVHPTGKSHTRMIDLQDEFVLQCLTQTAQAIKKHGAVANIELSHGGKFSDVDQLDLSIQSRNVRYAPSACTLPSGAKVEEMPKTMIQEIIESFGKGAAIVKRTGFDMLLLHAGHGWLIHQFLNTAENQRTDEYGGSIQNRTRILIEVLDNIRAAVGKDFPIQIRMSAEDYLPGGNSFNDTIEICKMIEDKVDLLQVSTGSFAGSFDKTHPSMFYPRGANVHYAAAIKEQVKVPVSTLGALDDAEMMEDIIKSGKADIVEMGRALIADPFLPKKIMTGREEFTRHCIRCGTCHAERTNTQTRTCSINPVIGREIENLRAFPPTTPKKVLIAGGGPGGMKCAITAAKRGHDVTLYEKKDDLGGALLCEKKVDFKFDFYDMARVLELEMKDAGVKIIKGKELTKEMADEEKPDVMVTAVGATPIMPPIPGIESDKVISGNDLSEDNISMGQNVVVMGGGLVGCEAAIHLAFEGRNVTIVEMLPTLASELYGPQVPIIKDKINELGIKIMTNTRGLEINDEGLLVETSDNQTELLPADTVLMCVGQAPLLDVVDKFRDVAPTFVTIGDCTKPGKVADALTRGYYAGLDI